jgi:uncharacterized protein YjbI with pentapeptide repeats
MENKYEEDRDFENIDYSIEAFPAGEYENCRFINCNFSGADLSQSIFSDSEFRDCNLAMAKLVKTAIRDCRFIGCKLTGLHFDHCRELLFAAVFDHCIIDLSSFYQVKLRHSKFNHCSVKEVDFTEADLTAVALDHCDLTAAVFDNTILEKTDFRTAFNYSFDPSLNKIKKAKFGVDGIAGLLSKFDIVIE